MPAYEETKQSPPPPPPPPRSKPRSWTTQLPTPPPSKHDNMSSPLVEGDQWLFTEEELTRTPSALDGISPEAEREQRSKGCNFIIQLGIQLKLPQLTLATASTYLHRFYMQNSLKRHHYYETAATALFLATKVEENMRKFGDIVAACVRAAQKNLAMEVHRDDKEFWRWKDCILAKEEYLLESICFDLAIDVPYNHLIRYTERIGVQSRPLMRIAWTFLNDATLTMLCVLYPPCTIAAAALYCAAKHCGLEFPDQDGKPWWEVIEVKIVDIKKCCNYMALVYENNPLRGDDRPRYVTTPEGGPETTKTRARCHSSMSPERRDRDSPPEKRPRTQSSASRDDDDRKRLRVGNEREQPNGSVNRDSKRSDSRSKEPTPAPTSSASEPAPEQAPEPASVPESARESDRKENPDLEEGELDD